jgi:hypothetical protein
MTLEKSPKSLATFVTLARSNAKDITMEWKDKARASGFRVFPITIFRDDNKWQKKPLVSNWANVATTDVEAFDWDGANGFGIAMGNGLYAFDLDDYKDGCAADMWMDAHGLTRITRIHRTISGGRHMFYKLPNGFEDLRNTNGSLAKGLDTRGAGGFIAFGQGYELLHDAPVAELSKSACKAILAQNMKSNGDVELRPLKIVNDPAALMAKLAKCLKISPSLARRWNGATAGLRDTSKSSMDMSVAQLLTRAGFDEHEVVDIILYEFDHGRARWMDQGGERAAMRCAARARDAKEGRLKVVQNALTKKELTPEQKILIKRKFHVGH